MMDDAKMLVKTLYDHVWCVLDAIYLYRPANKEINDAPSPLYNVDKLLYINIKLTGSKHFFF